MTWTWWRPVATNDRKRKSNDWSNVTPLYSLVRLLNSTNVADDDDVRKDGPGDEDRDEDEDEDGTGCDKGGDSDGDGGDDGETARGASRAATSDPGHTRIVCRLRRLTTTVP